jgi:xanthine phosphoribosyltransferase
MIDATSIIDYTYPEFLEGINKIAKEVLDSKAEISYIVGIVRGGAVPAVYLAHKLKLPVVMIQWSARDSTFIGNESNCWVPEDINAGKTILIVDDILDGGDTIRELLADWQSSIRDPLNMDNIRIATMIYNEDQETPANFYHYKIKRSEELRWYCFPWE